MKPFSIGAIVFAIVGCIAAGLTKTSADNGIALVLAALVFAVLSAGHERG